jgi:hypothetical protein
MGIMQVEPFERRLRPSPMRGGRSSRVRTRVSAQGERGQKMRATRQTDNRWVPHYPRCHGGRGSRDGEALRGRGSCRAVHLQPTCARPNAPKLKSPTSNVPFRAPSYKQEASARSSPNHTTTQDATTSLPHLLVLRYHVKYVHYPLTVTQPLQLPGHLQGKQDRVVSSNELTRTLCHLTCLPVLDQTWPGF